MKQLLVVLAIAAAVIWAASQSSQHYSGLPVFACCGLAVFGLQWLAFVPAFIWQTERFYDLTGSATYIAVVGMALFMSAAVDARAIVLSTCVVIWALRLGSFLFLRILRDGSDSRFDRIKPSPLLFFNTWTLQGLWVLLTASAALAAITAVKPVALAALDYLALALWLMGFSIEVIADRQKRKIRARYGPGTFACTGLWARSRHPNYFGEILLWMGIALLALPALEGWRYVTLISPLFVGVLLTRVSGIPLLERKADNTWGHDPDYQRYKATTPVLVPRLIGSRTGMHH
jgi:steroid 5-alpha reductase family enzyme